MNDKCISITLISHVDVDPSHRLTDCTSPLSPTFNQTPRYTHSTHPEASAMAPYSPAIGLSLAHESQAPPPPKLSTKLLSSLLSPQIQVLPLAKHGSIPIPMKPRKLDYSPHTSNTHGRPEPRKSSWPGFSTVIFSVLLVMLIGVSSSQFQYEPVGREQSMLDIVKDAYFDPGTKINARDDMKVYLVEELLSDMQMNMRKRDDESTSVIAPVNSPSAVVITSSASSSMTSSARATPSGAKSNFRNPDDVRDPTAVKPSDDMESQPPPDDTQPTDLPNKRHWSSRNRGLNVGKRSP
jgi:hypothetical protein